MANYKTKLHQIKAFAFDVDGVLTDGTFQCTADGDLLRIYNAKDGFGLRTAINQGFPVAIITGGLSKSISNRLIPVGVKECDLYQNSRNKIPDFEDFCSRYGFKPEEVAFMGDDIPDIPILKVCGLAACPADAVPEVKAVCDYVSAFNGGKGCVRDLIEQVLKIDGKWFYQTDAISG